MTDYGHDLLFGAFITPSSRNVGLTIELTLTAERSGLDLATFQDHPYQPAFLDSWTLMSYLAARTERIRFVPSVLNLPLRPPVVLARAAASLDLLSNGRLELGLGAGAFWDAIEASGGTRLSPGDSVVAVEEAIRIIREVWAVGEPGGVRVDGEHYRVLGAKRGPAPAHDIGIWLGAYKPRMLRLTGRAADGWIATLARLDGGSDALSTLNAHIDEGAAAAERDPAAIRRILNLTDEVLTDTEWADQLTVLALEHGISGFVIATDDGAAIERFGQSIAPAVRDAVEAVRGTAR